MNQQKDKSLKIEAEINRSSFLTTLCILTYIGSGLAFIANVIFALNYATVVNFVEKTGQTTSSILPSSTHYYINAIFALFSLIGAFLMWGRRKKGFYIYSIAQVLISVFPVIILGENGISTFAIIISGLFIFLYALSYKEFQR